MPNIDKLSQDQHQVLRAIVDWYKHQPNQHLTVGGYAGTGKTTLLAVFRKLLHKHQPKLRVAFCAFTGKASQVLQTKLKEFGALYDQDSCGTIHSLIYKPQVNSSGVITRWYRQQQLDYDLIVVDEASMVTGDIWHDLLQFDLPILAVGDHGQLPPVGDDFNLMDRPEVTLNRIHRQAQDSPIIKMATMARIHGQIPIEDFARNARKLTTDSPDSQDILERVAMSDSDQLVLCARNKTRIELNGFIRGQKYFESPEPQVQDTVICLKNNYQNKDGPIYNGMIGYIDSISEHQSHWYEARISFPVENRVFDGLISKHQFNQPTLLTSVDGVNQKKIGERFDFGYALTVHKAQGSQAETVVIYEEGAERWMGDSYPRWLYTAITRATSNVYLFA